MFGEERKQNAAMFSKFPHVVYASQSRGPILTLDRSASGSIEVIMDIRSSDGKIIARMNRDGFVVNRNNYLDMRRDKVVWELWMNMA
jgi:hypothetical protein